MCAYWLGFTKPISSIVNIFSSVQILYFLYKVNNLTISNVGRNSNILALPSMNIFYSETVYKYPEVISVVKSLF